MMNHVIHHPDAETRYSRHGEYGRAVVEERPVFAQVGIARSGESLACGRDVLIE